VRREPGGTETHNWMWD